MGHRGCAATVRAAGYLGMGAKEYVTKANNETMAIAQIEDPEGVQNIESIVKTEGVDCVIVGPNDLSLSMGYPGRADAPEVQEAIEKVLSTTLNAGLTFMIGADERTGPQWIKRGARVITINIVPFFRRKWTELMAGLRESGAS
jgi:2-keto-3-deoxy-L-rhamnonate aldolase RhmA